MTPSLPPVSVAWACSTPLHPPKEHQPAAAALKLTGRKQKLRDLEPPGI